MFNFETSPYYYYITHEIVYDGNTALGSGRCPLLKQGHPLNETHKHVSQLLN